MRKPLDCLLFVYRRVAFNDQGTYQGINTNTFNHVTNTGSLEVQFMLGCRAHYIFKKKSITTQSPMAFKRLFKA